MVRFGAAGGTGTKVQGPASPLVDCGMADELGPEYLGGPADGGGLDGNPYAAWEPKEYSEATAERIDAAVRRLIDEAHDLARSVLSTHRIGSPSPRPARGGRSAFR